MFTVWNSVTYIGFLTYCLQDPAHDSCSIYNMFTLPLFFVPKACVIKRAGGYYLLTVVHASYGNGTCLLCASIPPIRKIRETLIYLEFQQQILTYDHVVPCTFMLVIHVKFPRHAFRRIQFR